ncbi:MAG: cobalamin biosynthesis protein CbiD [Lachnospiraceae bacterium]|nr:cobalamin biosynthesis protein CbiD [Lachnospiraceae bacterium]
MERKKAADKPMKKGFTTGSCAAAASAAAARMLFTGEEISSISIETPAGEIFTPQINYVNLRKECFASCAVLKDGGDDPDVTTGLYIFSRVSIEGEGVEEENGVMSTQVPGENDPGIMSTIKEGRRLEAEPELMSTSVEKTQKNRGLKPDLIMSTNLDTAHANEGIRVVIDGGEGIGRVTRPGLDRRVGEAAINSVPRGMIEEAVRLEALKAGFKGLIKVMISAPGGERVAEKTFNPRLGIVGGISILGTSGVENPMSMQAIIDTIEVEMRVHKAAGEEVIAVTPGNYGQEYMLKEYGYDLEMSVKCSNFIGNAIELASKLGFKAMLLTGHIGKLIKLAGGITNTHSLYGDCRMELLCAAALRAGCSADTARAVLQSISTDEALRHIKGAGLIERTMENVLERVMDTLRNKAKGDMEMECIIYSNVFGRLAHSSGAAGLLDSIRRQGIS